MARLSFVNNLEKKIMWYSRGPGETALIDSDHVILHLYQLIGTGWKLVSSKFSLHNSGVQFDVVLIRLSHCNFSYPSNANSLRFSFTWQNLEKVIVSRKSGSQKTFLPKSPEILVLSLGYSNSRRFEIPESYSWWICYLTLSIPIWKWSRLVLDCSNFNSGRLNVCTSN